MVDNIENYFVTAVLVTHDGARWLPQVIATLSSQTRRIDRIIAVDTGSKDSSVKLLRSAGIAVIEAERDIGYGDAIEIALAHSPVSTDEATAASEWIWLIHDDCAPKPTALELMLAELVDRPQVVIAGPKLLGWYDRDHLLEAGVSIAINGARWTGLENREQDQGQQNFTRDVLTVSTAAMLVRRTAFVELGGLDPNLALFRDDVDLGWRAHVAGFGAICVGAATVYHAEASASERRDVDVSEAFLHRPLLLDRRNAAYVLLVNSSWWMLPWVSLQLLGTSLLRALFDLFAKLPGYAGDELAAIGLLLIHPRELITARTLRRKKRLLSPSVVKRFIPPRGSQIRAGVDRVTSLLLSSVAKNRSENRWESEGEQAPSYTDLGTIDDEFDSPDLSAPIKVSIIRNFVQRPEFLTLALISFLSLLAGRNRFGQLSGGTLALVPQNAIDLFRSYTSAWHPVGMGTAAPMPPWALLLSLASILTFGHLALLVSLLFFIAPPLAFYIFTKTLRRLAVAKNFATVGGVLYTLNPLLWTSLNQGRIGTILLFLLLPVALMIKPFNLRSGSFTLRRIFAITLLVSAVGAFSPLLFAIWLLGQGGIFGYELYQARSELRKISPRDVFENELFLPLWKRSALIVTPLLLLSPWSFLLLIHPTQWLVAPGVPGSGGSVISTLLFNPGGAGSPPLWLIGPIVFCAIYVFAIRALSSLAFALSFLIGGALLLSSLHIEGHGSVAQVWSGDLLLVATIIALPPLLKQAEDLIPTLRTSRLGLTHLSVGLAAVLMVVSTLAMGIWVAGSASQSLVRGNQNSVLPAFVGALESAPTRPKTLVLAIHGSSTSYFITRGSELALGDADVASAVPMQIQVAVSQLVTGSGLAASTTLGSFGIDYLFVKAPTPLALENVIDGIGGFVRISSTPSGTLWKIANAAARVEFISAHKLTVPISSQTETAGGTVTTSGQVILAEAPDRNWKLLVNGSNTAMQVNAAGLPTYVVAQGGTLLLTYDDTLHRILLSLQFLTLLIALIMVLPSGRRRVEVPLEELV